MMNPKSFLRDFLNKIPFGMGSHLLAASSLSIKPFQRFHKITIRSHTTQTGIMKGSLDDPLPTLGEVSFGDTGLEVSRLAFGTGTHGVGGHSIQSALGIDGLADLLVQAYDYGVNFWDSADEYGTHPHLKRALQTVPRDGVVILTKTMARDEKRVSRDIDRFLNELGIEVIDIVLMHFISSRSWTDRYAGPMAALTRAKEQGKVRAVGISSHSLAALESAAQTDWTDVVMTRVNYAGVNMDTAPEEAAIALSGLHGAGKAVLGMKVLGVGRLSGDVQHAVDYVFGLGNVHAITLGMRSLEELVENIRIVADVTG